MSEAKLEEADIVARIAAAHPWTGRKVFWRCSATKSLAAHCMPCR
jgi:hypothetical protein